VQESGTLSQVQREKIPGEVEAYKSVQKTKETFQGFKEGKSQEGE
jgi:hypothetical protein